MAWTSKWFVRKYISYVQFFNIFNFSDKFDQFWAVNRRLMETPLDQDGFKHIPMRCYSEVKIKF